MILPGYPEAAPLAGLAGGTMIGVAAAVMLLGLGRIAGISGIAARASGISASGLDRGAAIAFIAGLPLGALVVDLLLGETEATFPAYLPLAVAGLVVGFGVRMGSGCTSGHGVCGMSRLSGRSIVATLTFMATGIATVAAMNALGIEVFP